MTESQAELAASNILMKLHIITGWQLPEKKQLQDELNRQLSLKLKESYATCNINEIEYAFRNNTQVIDWGKNINLSLIDQVMIPYLSQRSEASEAESTIERPLELPTAPMSDAEVIEVSRDIYASTKNYNYISSGTYERLLKMGLINLTDEQKEEIKLQVKSVIIDLLQQDPKYFNNYSKEKHEIRLCKKIACAKYFESLIKI